MERCGATIYRTNSEPVVCTRLNTSGSRYCYHHNKYFTLEGYLPSPRDWPSANSRNSDYIVKIEGKDGEVRDLHYFGKYRK